MVKVGWRQWGNGGDGSLRSSVEARLVDLGYARELAHLVAAYIPLLTEEVAFRWPPVGQLWPSIHAFSYAEGEEWFAVSPRLWYDDLKKTFHNEAKGVDLASMPYMALTCQLNDFLKQYHPVHYLTPEENLQETLFRIAVKDGLIVLKFPRPMTLRRSLQRFNERVLLLLSDIKTYVAPRDPIIAALTDDAAAALLHTDRYQKFTHNAPRGEVKVDMSSIKLHAAMRPSIQRARDYVQRRDSSIFRDLCRSGAETHWVEKVNAHIDAIWKFATPQSREAIWRALEDIIELDSQVSACIFQAATGWS